MQILLIARCQFICICILFMLLIYTIFNKRINTRSEFTKICVTAFLQVTLDFITIILVNLPRNNAAMKLINRIAHILVVYFAVLFCYYFMCYIARMIYSTQITKKVSYIGSIPIVAYLFLCPFIDFDYIKGRGTSYVGGMYVDFWFFVGLIYILVALVMLFRYGNRLDKVTVITLEGIILFMVLALVLQVKIPELLLTGGTICLITFALYLTLEDSNTGSKYRVAIDVDTGVKSKNAFMEDVASFNHKYFSEKSPYEKIGMVICDIFDMASINDKYGLMVGDDLIVKTADIISATFKKAYNIYRIKGAAFAILYVGRDEQEIYDEYMEMMKEVAKYNKEVPFNYVVTVASILKENTEEDNMENIILKLESELSHQKAIMGKKYKRIKD